MSQDILSSHFPIPSLVKYHYSGLVPRCSTSDVYVWYRKQVSSKKNQKKVI